MRVVDLFAGCGGMSKGFENAGLQVVAALEYWDAAVNCYQANFHHPIHKVDLSDVDLSVDIIKEYNPDVIIGGPPCQDFSHAGKRTEGNRADLTICYSNIICKIKPKWFVMENVDRAQKSNAYDIALSNFVAAGYGLTKILLNAANCNVPQDRKRFFVIGKLGESNDFLNELINNGLSKKKMTLREYFGDEIKYEYYYRHPRNYSRRAVFSIDEPAPTMRGVNRPVPDGYPGHPKDACQVKKDMYVLSTLDRAMIQTFPRDFKLIGTKSAMEQMIGNAVPVNLASFVASVIISYENNATINDVDFLEWLVSEHKFTRKSAYDIKSRLIRACGIIDFMSMPIPEVELMIKFEYSNEFKDLSTSVRSQIKRSIKLYYSFLGLAA